MTITLKVEDKEVRLDNNQYKAYKALNNINQEFRSLENIGSSFISKIFRKLKSKNHNNISGIYIYGRVGRGKSMLMKNFYNDFPCDEKIYIHFNSFMQEIHKHLYKMRQSKDFDKDNLIELVTKNVIKNNCLLCLDEFQVDDVTDALILRRIFTYIFEKGVTVIFTSNSKPDNLYQNGLQRDLFLKFVDQTLKQNCQIFNLDSEVDYREKFLHKVKKHYFYPIDQENEGHISNLLSHLTHENETYEEEIKVLGRSLIVKDAYENIAIFDFKDICVDNIGIADYQEICKKYSIIFVLNVPKLKSEDRNEAKRLILFIDEVYEKKVNLILLAECKMEEIYQTGTDSKKFKRTVSRLKEIMSDGYGKII